MQLSILFFLLAMWYVYFCMGHLDITTTTSDSRRHVDPQSKTHFVTVDQSYQPYPLLQHQQYYPTPHPLSQIHGAQPPSPVTQRHTVSADNREYYLNMRDQLQRSVTQQQQQHQKPNNALTRTYFKEILVA